jgi:hypothetical protein
MKEDAKFEIFNGLKRKFFVELMCSLVVLEQKKLDHPIEHEVEDAGDGIEDGEATAVHQAAPEVGEELGIDVMTENLRASIKVLQISLKFLPGVASIILGVQGIFLDGHGAPAISLSPKSSQTGPKKTLSIRREHVQRQRDAQSCTHVLIPQR